MSHTSLSKNAKFAVIVALFVLVLFALGIALTPGSESNYSQASVQAFAECLAQKGTMMYGAYWCPHCEAQKKLFGDAFKSVPYVECTQKADECNAKGVTGYPTWIFADGSKVEGEQTFNALAQKTGCSAPTPSK